MRGVLGCRVGRLERVGQEHREAVLGQLAPVGQHALRQAELRDGVRADEDLEPVEVPRHRRGPLLPRSGAERLLGRLSAVLERGEQVRPGSHGRVEHDDAGIGEAEIEVEPLAQELRDERDLRFHHFGGRVVDAALPAGLGS